MYTYQVTEYEKKDYEDFKKNLTPEKCIELLKEINVYNIPECRHNGTCTDFHRFTLHCVMGIAIDMINKYPTIFNFIKGSDMPEIYDMDCPLGTSTIEYFKGLIENLKELKNSKKSKTSKQKVEKAINHHKEALVALKVIDILRNSNIEV